MKQEDKVPTREQCQKLFELGIRVSAEHSWYFIYGGWKLVDWQVDKGCIDDGRGFPAPDVAELGELLSVFELQRNWGGYWTIKKYTGIGTLHIFPHPMPEAQARCAALIWLIENKHLNLKDLK